MTELIDLVGLHMLDAVDFETVSLPDWEGADTFQDARACRFRIDGVVWMVIEDPSDGYRSSMRELKRLGDGVPMANSFPSVQILCVHLEKNRDGYGKADVLVFLETTRGKQVLEVGTLDSNDYYPAFVADFRPENMPVNADAERG